MAKQSTSSNAVGRSPIPNAEDQTQKLAKRRPRSGSQDPPPGENSIRPSRARAREAQAVEAKSPDRKAKPKPEQRRPSAAPASDAREHAVPGHIRERFVQIGNKYYFADGTRAFTDRGRRLVTSSENTEVIRSLIIIAQSRGWQDIIVSGTERFRKEAWFAAATAGLTVRGYRPSEFEKGHLARSLAREGARRAKPDQSRSPARSDRISSSVAEDGPAAAARTGRGAREGRGGLLTGRLVDHGVATYRHDPREALSYFVRIETREGEREIWGVDLQRALKESLTQPAIGDEIGLRAVRQDTVTIQSPKRDSSGKVIGKTPLAAHRNRWILERREFFTERAAAARTVRNPAIDPKQAVKQHPELIGTYLQVHAAEIAARQFRDPQDQQRFVAQVRSALADSVARGEPLPPVRLRERAVERQDAPARNVADREHAPVRG